MHRRGFAVTGRLRWASGRASSILEETTQEQHRGFSGDRHRERYRSLATRALPGTRYKQGHQDPGGFPVFSGGVRQHLAPLGRGSRGVGGGEPLRRVVAAHSNISRPERAPWTALGGPQFESRAATGRRRSATRSNSRGKLGPTIVAEWSSAAARRGVWGEFPPKTSAGCRQYPTGSAGLARRIFGQGRCAPALQLSPPPTPREPRPIEYDDA